MGALWQTAVDPTPQSIPGLTPAPSPSHSKPPRSPWRRAVRRTFWLLVLLALAASGWWLHEEITTATYQSRYLSRYAATLGYELHDGPSNAIRFPDDGPFDKRLGYAYMPQMLERLQKRDFLILQQTHFSPALLDYNDRGLFIPYPEKLQSGLAIADCRGLPLYGFTYPQQLYSSFHDIPPLVVNSLLFIENRDLLDNQHPLSNPAVDWPRFVMAALTQVGKKLDFPGQSAGGSTLATQLEKYRHAPDGRTLSATDKLKQMASASVRAYQSGPDTLPARQNIVRDYLNSVPLSAAPGYGEVHGLADGLRVWYGADFVQVNQVLEQADADPTARGLALRQVLSLMIAQRRPSYYLAQGHEQLAKLTDSHIRLLAAGGVIDHHLRDAALGSVVTWRDLAAQPGVQPVESNKGISVARSRLSTLLNKPLYDLDRLDLAATTTLNGQLQQAVSDYLQRLADPEFASQTGLLGDHLLTAQSTQDVRYSFTLFERTADGARVRVQTDSTDQPFDINEGSKLELGSTAKLRVLTTYLEIIDELHQRFVGQTPAQLRKVEVPEQDRLTQWAVDYLASGNDPSLPAMLDAALERHYSASPAESFFTGGGLHHFNNFRREDNGRNPTLKESLQESINLPFIRLMRDVVRYSTYQASNSSAELLKDDKDPRRQDYLKRFADREGTVFLLRFWRKYQNKNATERLDTFLDGMHPTASRLAAVHRYLMPDVDEATFGTFINAHLLEEKVGPARVHELYVKYGPGAYNLPDQGYIARVHPLELWLLGYLQQHPQATFTDAVTASDAQRQEVYGWLFKSRHKSARDSRIRIMLEVEAFLDIHQRWQRVGYPFDHLVPSLATAIGSSGDRPAALAELMGIILNDGIRQPTLRIDSLHFAVGTPYETRLGIDPDQGKRVLSSEVASALRGALAQVVAKGTARRLNGSFTLDDGSAMVLGGKTGTGDNRIESVGAGGRVLTSRSLNRTATFVFYLGEHHFGTLTAFVPGREAAGFRFTSALPVQVLKGMAPILQPYLQVGGSTQCQVSSL